MQDELEQVDENVKESKKKHPFQRYTMAHLMYDPGLILDDDEFHRHAEKEIENVSCNCTY